MQSETTTKTKNHSNENIWLYIFIFCLAGVIYAGLCYLLCLNKAFVFKAGEKAITFAMNTRTIKWLTFLGIELVAISSFYMYISRYTKSRPPFEITENFISLIIHLTLFAMWPLFLVTLSLPIVSCVLLGLSIVVAIYTIYRYFNSSITAGILFSIWTLWLIYLFVLNLAYCLK